MTVSHDWHSLKAEFLSGNETLNKFRLRHKINKDHFYRNSKGWGEERDKMKTRAMGRAVEKTEQKLAKQWSEYTQLWSAVRIQAAAILKRSVDETGRITKPVDPADLRALASAIDIAFKGDRLIFGEPTEITKNEGESSQHVHIVQVLQMLKKSEINAE